MVKKDQRAFSRVPCYLQARFRRLACADEAQACPSPADSHGQDIRAAFSEHSNLPEEVAAFLLAMDSKLDLIISQMRKDSLDETFRHKLTVLEISAAGLMVQSDDLKVGDHLEVVLSLSEFPARIASAIGVVIRPADSDKAGVKTFGFQFTKLREADREEIIHFVFQEERRRIRQEKFS